MKLAMAVLLILAVLGGALAWPAWKRERDWKEVDRALARLEASVADEPVLTLRSKIADTAAALDIYQKSVSGRWDEPRVRHAEEALTWLRRAIDLPARATRLKSADWPAYWVHQLGANEIERKCGDDGDLYVDGAGLKFAYAWSFRRELEISRSGSALLPAVSYDFRKNIEECRKKKRQRDERAAAAARVWRARWPIELTVKMEISGTLKLYADGRAVVDGFGWASESYTALAKESACVRWGGLSLMPEMRLNGRRIERPGGQMWNVDGRGIWTPGCPAAGYDSRVRAPP